MLPRSDATAFIFAEEFIPVVEEAKPEVKNVKYYVCVSDNPPEDMVSYEELIKNHPPTEIPGKYWPKDDDPCLLLYTAGTTGRPKGVDPHPQRQVLSRAPITTYTCGRDPSEWWG